jgi:hypothetical protein
MALTPAGSIFARHVEEGLRMTAKARRADCRDLAELRELRLQRAERFSSPRRPEICLCMCLVSSLTASGQEFEDLDVVSQNSYNLEFSGRPGANKQRRDRRGAGIHIDGYQPRRYMRRRQGAK